MGRNLNTMVYSRKAYHEDKKWAESVEETQKEATSLEHHIELLAKLYPNHIIQELYTYEHSGMFLERTRSCKWDSSLDGMVAYKKETELEEKIKEINEQLM